MIHCKPDQLEGITMIPARRCGPACVTPADKPELMRCSWPANTFQRYRNGLAQPSTPQLRKFLQAFNFIQKLWQNSFPENTRNCKKKRQNQDTNPWLHPTSDIFDLAHAVCPAVEGNRSSCLPHHLKIQHAGAVCESNQLPVQILDRCLHGNVQCEESLNKLPSHGGPTPMYLPTSLRIHSSPLCRYCLLGR